jgi:gliding motility-associated-like protein
MRPALKVYTVIFLGCLRLLLFPQGTASKWYFGFKAGLDFSTNPPTVLTNGRTYAIEGTASVADGSGNLLFYTSGDTIWNSAHQVMVNGTGLLGTNTSGQAALIIKQPGNLNIYFIFTTDGQANPGGLCYTTVDMNLATGMGAVTAKNVQLITPTTEKLTATRHCNGVDVWVLSHDMYSATFRAYLVTSAGVNPTPTLTAIGPVHTYPAYGPGGGSQGSMKLSPNGRKLALGIPDQNTFELYDFDNSNGSVSNQVVLTTNYSQAARVEFSPDNTKLYGTGFYPGLTFYQWDVCAGSAANIISSTYTFTMPTNTLGVAGPQLGPDGKIYLVRGSMQTHLGVIQNPNASGAAMNYVDVGQPIAPGFVAFVLPNFMSASLSIPVILPAFTHTVNPALTCLTASFTSSSQQPSACISPGYSIIGQLWNFGDPGSGAANTSTLTNPAHVFSSPGTYSVQLILYNACRSDTVRQLVAVGTQSLFTFSQPASCYSAGSATAIIINGTGPFSYTWTPSVQNGSVAINLGAGNYSVTATGVGGCRYSGTVAIVFQNVLSGTISVTSPACAGQSNGSASVSLTGAGIFNYTWSGSAQTASFVTGLASGIYTLNVTDQLSPCVLTSTFGVQPALPVSVTASADTVCVGQTLNLYAASAGSYTYSWTGPNAFTSSQQNPVLPSAFTGMSGVYQVTVTTPAGCTGSASVTALVLPGLNVTAVSNTPCALNVLAMSAAGGNSYQWNGPGNFSSNQQSLVINNPNVSASGIYTVIVAIGSCSSTALVSVTVHPLPVITASNPGIACETKSIQLTAFGSAGNIYSWMGPGGFTSSLQNPVISNAIFSGSGTYTAVATNSNNCQAFATTTVIVVQSPTAVAFPAVGCTGQQINLDATGGNGYQWAGPSGFFASGQNVSFVAAGPFSGGVYTLTIIGNANCNSTATVLVTIHPLPEASVLGEPMLCAPVCSNFSLRNEAPLQAPITKTAFQVNNEFYPQALCFKKAGNYTVKAIFADSNNCVNSTSLAVKVYEKPVADFEFIPLKPLAAIDEVAFTNASQGNDQISWTWFFEDNAKDPLSGEQVSYLFETAGTFPVAMIVKNNWGCSDTAVKSVVIEDEFSLYVPNAFTPDGDGLNDTFRPKGTGIKKYSLVVMDRWGEQLYQTEDFFAAWDGMFKGKLCKTDVYVWKITAAGSSGKVKQLQGHVTLYK